MIHIILKQAARTSDYLEHLWEERFMSRGAGLVLVIVYLSSLLVIEVNRRAWLPDVFAEIVPTNHFFAFEYVFTALLLTEVVSLIFALTHSFSRSIGIQLEILSLILLRNTFKQFTYFSEPIRWDGGVSDRIDTMIAGALGALVIFGVVGAYYRLQRALPITSDEVEKQQFIAFKKLIAVGLIVILGAIGLDDFSRLVRGEVTYPFFETFYTVLIFTDVLMVLISLRYGQSFAITFRNFGFSTVTVFIRLALIAPTVLGVLMSVSTSFFALALVIAYNLSGQEILKRNMSQEHTGQPAQA